MHGSVQAWVFAAFEDPERAPIYYTNALIYAVPALSRGFNLDTFSVLCLLAGIAHVQVCSMFHGMQDMQCLIVVSFSVLKQASMVR